MSIRKLWKTARSPSVHISLGVLTVGGFLAGVAFWGSFNTALEVTNTEAFCISCHEMEANVYKELQSTVHWSNSSGVRATCPDCHVPHNWTDKVARKMQASKEVLGKLLGTIDTPEKFDAKRLELAQHEWARFSANKSLECKNCHDYKSMDFVSMSEKARVAMKRAAERDQSCVDCHKGIAHKLPDLTQHASSAMGKLEQSIAVTSFSPNASYYVVRGIEAFEDAELKVVAGRINPATEVKVVEVASDRLKVELAGWRRTKGFGRMINEMFGFNIASGVVSRAVAQNAVHVQGFERKEDPMTGLEWERVNVSLWIKPAGLTDRIDDIWSFAKDTYRERCSVCHTQPDEDHFDANTWPGMFNGMLSFVSLDGDSQTVILKYLQKHSADFSTRKH
ncbi:pentaheme c-type cytochrome TorC [Denitromonas sp.]|uniref:pentaheme c-type cytochrome TorC n=1 Tax=Denitromonas sp. TaxID=2734609 RepID=UPI003A838102